MKKYFIAIILFLIILETISSIRINEIEINPVDGKLGKEWVEIYNDENEDIDISGWSIYDGMASEKKRYTFPDGTVLEKEDYLTVDFNSMVLNNGGDFVILKDKNGEEIDRTPELKEEKPTENTWQYCESEGWVFVTETKDKKNNCNTSEEKQDKNNSNININANEEDKITEQPITFQTINLEAKTIKSTQNNKGLSKDYSIYGIIGFCILILLLFVLRKQKYRKNEFN
jgi:hypothetical protein